MLLPLLVLLLLPLAVAEWLVSVDATLDKMKIFGYADSYGCIAVGSGSVISYKEFNGASFQEMPVGDYICVDEDTLFEMTLRGDYIFLKLPKANVRLGSTLLSSVSWRTLDNTTLVYTQPQKWLCIFVLIVLLGAALIYFVRRHQQRVSRTLEDSVIEFVASHPGCTQKDICKTLGLQKYQVSRILSRLEQRGVIVRVRKGISKRVYLREQLH